MHAGDLLDAGIGLSSYLWNSGDTTESIVINAEGMYSLEMESPVGCLGSDSVYVKLTTEEIPETHLFIPNAFTPDGDGVNDTFQALYNGNDISHFTMEVYDRWGGRIFRSGKGRDIGAGEVIVQSSKFQVQVFNYQISPGGSIDSSQ